MRRASRFWAVMGLWLALAAPTASFGQQSRPADLRPPQKAARVVVRHVRIPEAHRGDALELMVERLEGIDEGETPYFHIRLLINSA